MATDSGAISFHDIAQNRNGLFVRPFEWTSHHLDMVGCRFESPPGLDQASQNDHRNDGGSSPDSSPSPSPSQKRSDAKGLATKGFGQETRSNLLMDILMDKKPHFEFLE